MAKSSKQTTGHRQKQKQRASGVHKAENAKKRQKLKYNKIKSKLDESVDSLFGEQRHQEQNALNHQTPQLKKSLNKWNENFSLKQDKEVKDTKKEDKVKIDDDFLQQIQGM